MPYFPTNMYVDPLSTIKVDLKIITKTYKKPPFKSSAFGPLLWHCSILVITNLALEKILVMNDFCLSIHYPDGNMIDWI